MTDAPQTDLSDETTAAPAAVVPDKAALEGLEAKWSAQWKADDTYAFDRTRPRSEVYSIDTPPPTVSGSLHVGPRLLLHPHRPGRALPADARQVRSSTRWAGTTTACRPSAGCRTTSASAATPRCRTTPTSRRPTSRTPSDRCRSAGPTSSSCASGSSWRTSRSSRTCGARSGSRSTGRSTTRRSARRRRRSASARSCATSPAARPTCRRRRPCGTSPSRPRSRRPSSRRASTPATTTASPSTAPTGPVHIETTRPELIPSVVALIAHPDDERYQPLFGTTVTSPVFGVEIPVLAHPAAEPDKGAGIAMCCTFGDLTDVTWWRELQLPVRTLIGRDGRLSRETPEWLVERAGRGGVRGAQGQDRLQRPRGDGRDAARERRPRRRADAHPADGELLREGRQAARDRGHPPVVHHQRRPRRRACARR